MIFISIGLLLLLETTQGFLLPSSPRRPIAVHRTPILRNRLCLSRSGDEEGDESAPSSIRTLLPLPLQYGLRDTGLLRAIGDTSTWLVEFPRLIQEHPSALPRYLQLTATNQRIAYGTEPRQVLDLFRQQNSSVRGANCNKLVVFFHGGAWGSGFPEMYRLVATPFLESGRDVCVVGYRTYPDAEIEGQVDDLVQAVQKLQFLQDWTEITLVAHSSGAHVAALALQRQLLSAIDMFVGISGVYDIVQHYYHEASRGVERLSPMSMACGGSVSQWRHNSPTTRLRRTGDAGGFPPATLVCHGELDTTVPMSSSIEFAQVLTNATENNNVVDLQVLPNVEHAEAAMHLLLGGPTRDAILSWMDDQGRWIAERKAMSLEK